MLLRNRVILFGLGTNVVALHLWGVFVLLGSEFDSEGLADDLRLARPVLGRVHVEAFKEAAVLVAKLG